MILRMLHLDPNRRITAKEIVIHPWLLSKSSIKANAPSLNNVASDKQPEEIKVSLYMNSHFKKQCIFSNPSIRPSRH
jgi:serine/threonine protein kinase